MYKNIIIYNTEVDIMKKLDQTVILYIINKIKSDPYITQNELAEELNLSERTIRRYFYILKSNDVLMMKKEGKIKMWIIK